MLLKIEKRKLALSLIFFITIFLGFFLKANSPLAWISEKLERLELIFYDLRVKSQKNFLPSKDIILIPIDEESIKKLGLFPWKRSLHARVIKNLKKTKVIAFDIGFITPSESKEDKILIQSINQSKNVILVTLALREEAGRLKILYPFSDLLKSKADTGFALYPYDLDGVVRRSYFLEKFENKKLKSFPLSILTKYQPQIKIPLYPQKDFLINYSSLNFNKIAYYKILKGDFPENSVKNKIALIYSKIDIPDYFFTPINRKTPGGEITAHALNTLLQEKYIYRMPFIKNYLINFFLIILAYFILLRFSLLSSWMLILAEILFFSFISFKLFLTQRIWINISQGIFLLVIFSLITALYESLRLKKIFSQFIPKSMLEKIIISSDKLELGGEQIEASILFSDIKSFVSLAEKINPLELMNFINQFHGITAKIAQKYQGTILDYQGDAQMIVFGAPLKNPQHAKLAVLAAWEIQEELKKIKETHDEERKLNFEIGIGIATGKIAYGLVGSKNYKQYAALGDSTNIASRLQNLAKELKAYLVINENTYKKVKELIEAELIPNIKIKGKEEALNVYKVIGIRKHRL
ncbi:MAG: adenylate/guanylate cyclase domain-containing protein [Armatimonadetes bacterium]|nr:adenylate/guanylate cyclase domain-containing protein [Armatimonadota bacterium]